MFPTPIRRTFIFLLLLASCASMSQFDQHAYIQATSVKVDALNLMSAATENYRDHIAEVHAINTQLDKAYEYERNRPNNGITLQLWDKLRDTSGPPFGVVPDYVAADSKSPDLRFCNSGSILHSKRIRTRNTNKLTVHFHMVEEHFFPTVVVIIGNYK